MKKQGKIALIVVASVLACVAIVAGSMAGVAAKAIDNSETDKFLSTWMSYLSDDARLGDVVIPGSHDSGTADMMWAARTQDKSIKEQMACGARYFDIRVKHDKGKLSIFHGPISAGDFRGIVDDIKDFLQSNPSETLLLDFQHFKGGNVVMELVDKELATKLEGRLVANDTQKTDVDFVKSLTIGDVRGKALVFWGNESGEKSNCDFIDGKNYLFQRNNDDGTRKDCVIHSYYDGLLNRKPSAKYLGKAIDKYVGKYSESNGALFVMQMQLTDPVLFIGPKFYEGTHDKNATEFISTLPGKEYFDRVNIIMRDFVGARKMRQILSLNKDKGTVQSAKLAEFETECTQTR